MSPSPGEITHVSDTALMVAACRALETDTPDGFVHDPFAARLSAERGMAILHAMPHAEMLRFGVGVRSRFLDELLLEALAATPIATVLSVGCGLDTRPWRLALPPALRWIEADFPDMLDYKESILSAETPRCRRERLACDLTDPAQRSALYVAAGTAPAILITEGLLMYLPAATVDALAAEFASETSITHWIMDITTAALAKAVASDTRQAVNHVRAADALAGEQILECLGRHAWTTAARRSYLTDLAFAAARVQRLMANRPQPAPGTPPPFGPDDPSGVHCFTRAAVLSSGVPQERP